MTNYLKLVRLIILWIGISSMFLQLMTFLFLADEVYLFADGFSFAGFFSSYAGMFIFVLGYPVISELIRSRK